MKMNMNIKENNQYQNWSKDELVGEIKKLKKRKKYGVVWEEEKNLEEVVEMCKEKLPILEENKRKEIKTDRNKPINVLIEGDNYHALSVLNYTHQGKIDVIYIDPPYNTGAKNWKYNNNYVDIEDAFRHSKWISFMYHRLLLAKRLLSKNGFLICAIDANELFSLGLLLDEVFLEKNRVGLITVLHNPKGRNQAKFFSENSEFMLVYARNINSADFNKIAISEEAQSSFNQTDELGKFRYEPFMRARTVWSRVNRPKNWYPIYISKDFKKITSQKKSGYYKVYPITNDGKEMAWKNIKETFDQLNDGNYFVAKKENNKIRIYHKYREQQVLKNVWLDQKYQSEFHGTNLLKKILGKNIFEYPKSVYLVADILKLTTKKDSTVLDFFAGSGTTGHSVLEINKEDGGNRQFILCTDNENNIVNKVCYPRIQKVIEGYKNGEEVKGLGGNLKFYKTTFINAEPTDRNKKELVDKSTEMLCLKEHCFEAVKNGSDFKIFKNNNGKYLGIVYDDAGIVPFKKEAKKINKKFIVYVFSLDESAREEEFEDVKSLVELRPIPAVILNVYKRIFK